MSMHQGWNSPYVQRKLALLTVMLVFLGSVTAVAAALRQPAAPTESTALPLAGMTILIDPGHGGYDGGARARNSGTWEKHINLQVALRTEQALTGQGAQVVMTRREDVDLTSPNRPAALTRKRQDMQRPPPVRAPGVLPGGV